MTGRAPPLTQPLPCSVARRHRDVNAFLREDFPDLGESLVLLESDGAAIRFALLLTRGMSYIRSHQLVDGITDGHQQP